MTRYITRYMPCYIIRITYTLFYILYDFIHFYSRNYINIFRRPSFILHLLISGYFNLKNKNTKKRNFSFSVSCSPPVLSLSVSSIRFHRKTGPDRGAATFLGRGPSFPKRALYHKKGTYYCLPPRKMHRISTSLKYEYFRDP